LDPASNIMKTLIRNCPFVQEDADAEVDEAALRAFG
jgi:hypothetical protein